MKICGIVAEYNPFHNGHKFQIEQARKSGCTHVVAAMSGNFVQRGDFAIASKWARARAAVSGGADLVIELPTPYSLSSAEDFATNAVSVLSSLGCVNQLCFGSECGDKEKLQRAALAMESEEYGDLIRSCLDTGISYPAAAEKAVCEILGETDGDFLKGANDILAIQYLRALHASGSYIEPLAVKRFGARHDESGFENGFASAGAIRDLILSKGLNEEVKELMPEECFKTLEAEFSAGRAPCSIKNVEIAVLSKLREMTAEDFSEIPGVSEGLENRIADAVKSAISLEELIDSIKTKRYAHSRIRRIILRSYLSLTKEYSLSPAPYIRVLALSEKGGEILKTAKSRALLPIITKAAHVSKLGSEFAVNLFAKECEMTDKFFLSCPKPMPCGAEMTEKITIQK